MSSWRKPESNWTDENLVLHLVTTAMGYQVHTLDEEDLRAARVAVLSRIKMLRTLLSGRTMSCDFCNQRAKDDADRPADS